MRSITFRLHEKLSTDQEAAALERVRRLPGVSRAEPIAPAASVPSLRRLGYCYVTDDASIDKVLKELESIPEVEDASVPADRFLPRTEAWKGRP